MFFGDLVDFARSRGHGAHEPWVGEEGVGAFFGVVPRTVRRWRRRGMPSQKLGGVRRYRISLCEAWLKEHSS